MTLAAYNEPETLFLTLPDGRQLAYARYGVETGRPLFYLHGLPGSRYECQLIDVPARSAGVSVIAPDRPGYGLTQPRRDHSLRAWTNDVAALADCLGVDRFSVVGVSGGAPCALACAHEMPDRVTTAGLVAGLGPVYEKRLRNTMSWPARFSFFLANSAPWLFKLLIGQPTVQLARIRPALIIRLLAAVNGGPDKRILLEPSILRAFTFSIQACFQQSTLGSVQDLQLFSRPWDFELGNIRQRVHLWHGDLDKVVPPSHSEYMHRHLPNSSLDIVAQEGHFSLPLKHMRDILETLPA